MSSLTPESQWIMEHHDTLDNFRLCLLITSGSLSGMIQDNTA